MPIETPPGDEAQFDWSDCSAWAREVGLAPTLWCFGMILCWSRWRIWWFSTSVDREHTFEGIARFFDAPGVCRSWPAPIGWGRWASRRAGGSCCSAGAEFARHYGVEIKACQAGDAKRKGKVERPFRDLKESFLQELVVTGIPDSIDEPTTAAACGLMPRPQPAASDDRGRAGKRFEVEAGFLAGLPARRFDTDYVETRRSTGPCRSHLGRGPLLGPTSMSRADRRSPPAVDATELSGRGPGASSPATPRRQRRQRGVGPAAARRQPRGVEPQPTPPVIPPRPNRPNRPRASRLAGDYDIAAPDLTVYEGGQT